MLLLVDQSNAAQNQVLVVQKVVKYTGIDKQLYTKLIFASATNLLAGTSLAGLKLMKPSQSSALWTLNASEASITSTTLTLNSINHQMKPGEYIVVVYNDERRWFKVIQASDVSRQSMSSSSMTINGIAFTLPGVTISVTRLTLDLPLNSPARKLPGAANWDNNDRLGITVYSGMQSAATVTDEPKARLSYTDPLYLAGFVETPGSGVSPKTFLLHDKNTLGAAAGGNIDYKAKKITLNQAASWSPELTLPVVAYGNVVTASRGEKVQNEKLGSGDASVSNQTFKLKKKPLTYSLSPTAENESGVSNSLTVYVNGIKWTEVNSFFGKEENDQVYIVRQNDDGESLVTFGDGIRGERVPSGVDNIIANYRFGAGSAAPPAESVNQIARPVKGLQGVNNMLPAYGGADAESAEDLRIYAPRSALLLGRVVSLQDMEALARGFPGVRAVQAAWNWNKAKQRASAFIFYIGEDGLASSLSQRLRNVSDPSTSITVEKATAIPTTISLNIQIDPRYMEADVLQQVRLTLTDKRSGLITPENIGIGQPLYRSKVFETVLKTPGTVAVESISLNRKGFNDFAAAPGAGRYFDIERGMLVINGKQN